MHGLMLGDGAEANTMGYPDDGCLVSLIGWGQ